MPGQSTKGKHVEAIAINREQAQAVADLSARTGEVVFVEPTNLRGIISASVGRRTVFIRTDGRTAELGERA